MLKMNPTDGVLVVVILLLLLQLLNHSFPRKVVGKVVLGYHIINIVAIFISSLIMIHLLVKHPKRTGQKSDCVC